MRGRHDLDRENSTEDPLVVRENYGPEILSNDKRLINFSGCDYLGLSNHPATRSALKEAVDRFGLSASASRITTGTSVAHLELEDMLASFLRAKDAVVTSSGHHAVAALLESSAPLGTHWFVDEECHPSAWAALRSTGVSFSSFRHRNADHLQQLLRRAKKPISILTDAVFPVTGDTAPLEQLAEIVPKDALLCVDESHSMGVLGTTGRGLAESLMNSDRKVVVFGSLSKGLGAFGGYLCGSEALCRRVRETSLTYQTSTALPPALCKVVSVGLQLLQTDSSLQENLWRNTSRMNAILSAQGLVGDPERVPIFQVKFADSKALHACHRVFHDLGLFVPMFRYPGALDPQLLRWTVQSRHTVDHLDAFAAAFDQAFGGEA